MATAQALDIADIDAQARELIRLMPVLRLRDARFMRRIHPAAVPDVPDVEITARQLDFLSRELVTSPQRSQRWPNPSGAGGHGATAGTLLF